MNSFSTNNLNKILIFKKACYLHVLNGKVHHRVEKIGNSIWSVLKFIKINFGLSLTCSYEINLKR